MTQLIHNYILIDNNWPQRKSKDLIIHFSQLLMTGEITFTPLLSRYHFTKWGKKS